MAKKKIKDEDIEIEVEDDVNYDYRVHLYSYDGDTTFNENIMYSSFILYSHAYIIINYSK